MIRNGCFILHHFKFAEIYGTCERRNHRSRLTLPPFTNEKTYIFSFVPVDL